MNISDVSIRNPVFAWMLMAALIVFGVIGFTRMGVSQLPDVDFPTVNVSVGLEGAAPEVIETTVVDPIESALMQVEGIKMISSSSKMGSANITAEFELEKNIDTAVQEIQTKIAQAQRLLPKDIDPPVITKTNPDDQPIIWLALTYDKNDPEFMMKFAKNWLKDRFTTVPGVGDMFLGGYTDPALRVWVKPEKLKQFNISVNDIIDAIQTEHSELPGGNVEDQKKNFNVRTMGEAKSVKEFESLIISRRAGQITSDPSMMVKLSQVASVTEGLNEVRRMSRFNGVPALGLGIKKQRGSNAVAVAKSVKAKMAEIQPQLPPGMNLAVNFDSTRFIEDSVHELNKHLVLAVILTSLVCWMFLGSWSATFNVLLSIPTSIMGTFIVLYFLGFTMNTFTLLGLTLAIGIVVDDAIMVLENIFRYNEKGYGRIESAIIGAREISFAAMAASIAVVAIFLPVAFMKGVIGKFFLQFGLTISAAVLLSLLESLTITPMRCASFVHHGERTTKLGRMFDSFMKSLDSKYARGLEVSLNNKWKILLGSIIFVVISFGIIKERQIGNYKYSGIRSEMTPLQDQSIFIARLTLPPGSSFSYMNEKTLQAEEWFRSQPEVKSVYAAVGGFGGSSADTNVSMLFVTLVPKESRKISQQEFMDKSRGGLKKIPELKAFLQDLSARGFSSGRGFPVEFTVMGPDWDQLSKQTTEIMKQMEDSGMMTDVDSNYLLGMPELQIVPDRNAAALHGVSVSAIGKTVNSLIGGVKVGQYPKDGTRYDIRLQLEKSGSPEKEVENLVVGNSRSNLIPLTKLVEKSVKPSLQSISRQNRQRAISVFANLKPGFSQPQAQSKIQDIAKNVLEPGYMIDQAGSSKAFKESFQTLIFALVMGFVVAYMVLGSQFGGFIDPFAVLMALPFSFSGAFFALKLTDQSLNIYSFIGILLLMGIVKKNSILLIEFTNQIREKNNFSAKESLINACPVRLRPILMTSLATIAGAIPSATAIGAGAETMRPMAVVIIGGVIASTLLTLFVVPVVYLLLDKFRKAETSKAAIRDAFANIKV